MAGPGDEAPKIIIDSDWKNQAQAEREKLAEAEAKAQASKPRSGAPGAAGAPGEDQYGPLPPADFRTLVEMLAMQALMYLGGVADRRTGQAVFDPETSRHMIDLLGVLEEKTKGNLTQEESSDLTTLLGQLRSRYVELSRMMAEQMIAGKGGPAGPGGGFGPTGPTPGSGVIHT